MQQNSMMMGVGYGMAQHGGPGQPVFYQPQQLFHQQMQYPAHLLPAAARPFYPQQQDPRHHFQQQIPGLVQQQIPGLVQQQIPGHFQQQIPGHWWTDIRSAWRSQDGGDEFWQSVFGDDVLRRTSLSSVHASSSSQGASHYQRLAFQLHQATKEDLNERMHQLRLTRDLLVRQKSSDAELLAGKIEELEKTLQTMNGERLAPREESVSEGREDESRRNAHKSANTVPRIMETVPVAMATQSVAGSFG